VNSCSKVPSAYAATAAGLVALYVLPITGPAA
jgi:hypothetical protein